MRKLLVATLAIWAMPVFAAYDAFLKIDTLKPPSSDASHPGWLAISGFGWDANAPAGTPACASGGFHFTVVLMEEEGISYYFRHSQGNHELIPEVTIEYMGARHQLKNVIVRAIQGNTISLHFAQCLTHPVPKVVPTGIVPNTTTRPQPPVTVSAGLVVPNTTPAPLNTQMRFDTGAQQFNLVSLRVTGLTAILKLRNESASFFQTASANRTKYTKVVMQKEALTFTFSNCVFSSYSHGTDGVDTIGLNFSIYSGPPLGYP